MIMISLDNAVLKEKELDAELFLQIGPSYSFLLDPNTKHIKILGSIAEENALRQSIYFMLRTRRYAYEIYSRDYGAEFWNFLGQDNDEVLMQARIRDDIVETLLVDDRISDVINFMFEKRGEILLVSFYVEYNLGYGAEGMNVEFEINTVEVVNQDD